MASAVDICNRALQKLGVKRITSLEELSVQSKACAACYSLVRDAELRKNKWSFAIKRAQLAALSDEPLFGRSYQYQLPSDYITIAPLDPEDITFDDDTKREGNVLLSERAAPIDLRYIHRAEVGLFDPLFVEALACKLAIEMCEELTQSNTKKASIKDDYREAIQEAKKANAIEKPAEQSPDDEWFTGREA